MASTYGDRVTVTPNWIQEGAGSFWIPYEYPCPSGYAVTYIAHKNNKIPQGDFTLCVKPANTQKVYIYNAAEISWHNAFNLYAKMEKLEFLRIYCRNPLILNDPTILIDAAGGATSGDSRAFRRLRDPFMVQLIPADRVRAHYVDGFQYTHGVIARKLNRL
jgi:hypothetical protein